MFGTSTERAWWTRPYAEIAAVGEAHGSVLVLPVGSVEQHGHHLPVGTDTILVTSIAALAADRLDESVPLLVAPPVWAGYSPHHLGFGGTFSLEFDTLRRVLEELASTGLENGFDAVLLLNGHGGNVPLISGATSTIGADHPQAEVLGLTYFSLAEGFIDEIRDSDIGGMAHGGEFETSLMLHLRPELVREDRIEGTPLDEPYERGLEDLFSGGQLGVYRPFDDYSETGAIGNPELATESKGRELADRLAEALAAQFREIHERNRSPDG